MPTVPIPNDGMQIEPGWFEAVLASRGVQARVRAIKAAPIGGGLMGSNVRYEFDYEQSDERAPASLIGKFPSGSGQTTEAHGVVDAYGKEIFFYRDLAAPVQDIVPEVWYAELDEGNGRFALILEDLSPLRALDIVSGCTPEDGRLAMEMAARLHASYWQSESLDKLGWLGGTSQRPMDLLPADFQREMWVEFKRRLAGRVSARHMQLGDDYFAAYEQWRDVYAGPVSLVHCDYRLENVLFCAPEASRDAAVVDWQILAQAGPAIDVAYFIGTSIEESVRKSCENDLLETYHSALVALGVDYAVDDFLRDYEWASFWGLMVSVGSMMLEGNEAGNTMLLTMFQRQASLILENGYAAV